MVFSENTKKMAQKLQTYAVSLALSFFFIFPVSNLLANESDLPVIIPNDVLLTPIELRDGLVLEVTVVPDTEIAFESPVGSEEESFLFTDSSDSQELVLSLPLEISKTNCVFEMGCKTISRGKSLPAEELLSIFENDPEHFPVKSIASPGLFGFLGICLSRSELPSKNFSMLCENSLPKSMTRRSANDWKFLWRPVKTTYLWPSSTNSYRMLKTSTLKPSTNLTPSMSDISSTWSNGMEEFPVTYCQGKRTDLLKILAPSLLESSQMLVAQNPNALPLNPRLL